MRASWSRCGGWPAATPGRWNTSTRCCPAAPPATPTSPPGSTRRSAAAWAAPTADQWLAARTGLDAALAETVALAADDVLLDDLLARLAQVPGAADLLLGVSVYREPVDLNAVLFQAGQPDPDAEDIPDRAAASEQISEILAAAGITVDESFDLASVPEHVRTRLAPHLAELNRRPGPAVPAAPDLAGQITACQAASLLTVSEAGGEQRFFVHRWTATELAGRAAREPAPQLDRGAPAGGRLLAVAGPGVAAGPGRRCA